MGGVLKSYPVGAIYTSTVETSPADLFGGTWEALPEGRVLLAQGASYPAGQEGGDATHAITEAEMPSHTHTGSTGSSGAHTHTLEILNPPAGNEWSTNANTGSNNNGSHGWIGFVDHPQNKYSLSSMLWMSKSSHSNNPTAWTRMNSQGQHTHAINPAGGSSPLSLMQPYLSVYMWRRTA